MSRRRQPLPSSLELLLDTICNTFGGVLFLTILVSVLLKSSSRLCAHRQEVEKASEATTVVLATRQQDLEFQLETLHRAVEQQARLCEQFAPSETADLLSELRELRAQRDKAEDSRREALSAIAELRRRANETAERDREVSKDEEAAVRELSLAKQELQREVRARTLTGHLPRLHSTTRDEVGVALKYNRLYVLHKYDNYGSRRGLNTNEFIVVSETTGTIKAVPKPYAGVLLKEVATPKVIAERLQRFDSKKQYLCVLVWDDSFEAFQMLKNAIHDLGFEYRLVLVPDGETIQDRGGKGGLVQ